jgi:hypothetical protein
MSQRRGGIIQVQADGVMYDAKGDFEYGLGRPKREGIAGSDGVHGFKETPQVPFIKGKITDRGNLDVAKMHELENVTVTLALANGKTIVLSEGWYAGDGTGNTGEGELDFNFEGKRCEEVPA